MTKEDGYTNGELPRGQFHRGEYVGVKATPLGAEEGREAFVWYAIVLTQDDGDVSVGCANKEAVKAAVGAAQVGDRMELPTYSKVTRTGRVSVRLAGVAAQDSGEWVTL